jgi:hypothetical protein
MTVEDTFSQHIAPFGIMNSGRGVKISDYMVGIYKNNPLYSNYPKLETIIPIVPFIS